MADETNPGNEIRRIQNAAMAGRELTPQQQALLNALLPEKIARSERLGLPAAEMTGVPSAARAYGAAGDFVEDPSLANATSVGANAAMAAFRPVAAAKVLGAGLAAGAGQDLVSALMGEANAQQPKAGASTFPNLPAETNAEYLKLKQKADRGAWRSYDERDTGLARLKAIEKLSNDLIMSKAGSQNKSEEKRLEEEEARKTAALTKKLAEDDRMVRFAETSRDQELARDRRFSDTGLGKVWDKTAGLMPMVFGAGAGALSRAATGPGSGPLTKALYDYAMPITAGGVAGTISYNTPLAYNTFFTEPDNPQKRAYEAYARELPPDHPRRQEWMDYASKLPDKNPVREAAANEFYDADQIKKRAFWGLVEGMGGGWLGADAFRWPARAANLRSKLSGDAGPAQTAETSAILDKYAGTLPGGNGPAPTPASVQTTLPQVAPATTPATTAVAPSPQTAILPSRSSLADALQGVDTRDVLKRLEQPKVKAGEHPDHNWNEAAGRWQDASGQFIPGAPPKK